MFQFQLRAATARVPVDFAARALPSVFQVNLVVAGFLLVADNATFWRRCLDIFGAGPQLVVFGAAIWALTFFIVALFGIGPLRRPMLAALLILGAATGWFQDRLGVTIDRDMIENVVTTTVAEGRHLVTPGFLLHLVAFGLLPALVVLRLPVRDKGWGRFMRSTLAACLALALGAGLILSDFKTFSAVLRERKDLVAAWQPAMPIGSAIRYAKLALRTRDVAVAPLGLDARKGPLLAAAEKPVLTVLVVGETARAQNWGLNGYARDTTPELRRRGVVNFPAVESCGTATAVSMPCMFSVLSRSGYSQEKGLATENLLDVLAHAGVAVEWWDNNTGDKDIAARVASARLPEVREACAEGECTDAAFLPLLDRTLATIDRDTVLVLHQIGSHGPAYHLRYPRAFERFSPACHSAEFSRCTDEEIRNAYDNTIAFTDHVLAAMIDRMAAQDRAIPALVYVSDHGESLGENGLYLHGAPRFMAPETQTRVPMVLWLSEPFRAAMALDQGCLRDRAAEPASHDNMFHSVLGLMDIRTTARDAALDRVSTCRAS
ncbi:lipid A ethanolaminephosphotransferase [Cereibacter ovatus]|uniref:Lipid A ethanolaminephosphotransferase n=1 Tax=Cereibacter ovatus TaxID=439529 RepID=A0A285CMQ2_9RHOB|nr:sulfatase-like hydrolase/transferase [Cereibacter ovatus]SNX68273.1 lipid A ethanolaminephosphotransferase [Cereibacter ovatus]